jgi:1,2-diacylglycerol 3-beta-galactosyltransferase
VQALVGASLKEAFDAFDPDLVVSVHPLMQHIPVRVLAARAAGAVRAASEARHKAREAALRLGGSGSAALLADLPPRLSRDDVVVPFATVVTDFTTCHNTWFYPGVDRCFVPTEFAAALAKKMGLDHKKQVVVHGLPIRPAFAREARNGGLSGGAKAKAKGRLGLPRGKPAILLIGGGEGMGALEATVRALDASVGRGASCAVVCGRNRHLFDKLRSATFPGGLSVLPVGFVDNMHEWMAAADLLITKAGPGTLAEALISGLPILINGNIPCQEEGNIPYIVDNGAGECERDPTKIGEIVARWLSPEGKEAFKEMARRSRALGRPEAVFEIARDLAALADEGAERRRRLLEATAAAERVEAEAVALGQQGKHRQRASCGGGWAVAR